MSENKWDFDSFWNNLVIWTRCIPYTSDYYANNFETIIISLLPI